jgi:uncharacterized membrane protein YbhN (UPF0104 family)
MASQQASAQAGRRVRLERILLGALVILVIGAAASLFGWNISGWFTHLWNTITSISVGYLVAAIVLLTLQTVTAGFAWYSILRHAYTRTNVSWLQVLACYATAVALNFILPANLGTLVMLVMFTTIIAGATFAGVLAGFVVQKIFFTLIGTACYVYLFLTVSGSFDLQLGFVESHPWAILLLLVGGVALLVLVARMLKPRVVKWWDQAKEGGQILADPKHYLGRVVLPEAVSWLAMLGVIAVFLAAYEIPISFETLMRIVAGNSIANSTSVTPGGAGVVQGFNVLSLKGVTSPNTATAYSVAQQLVTTAWSILLAIVLLVRAFGWSGGRALVAESYGEAREKSADQAAARRAKRQARRHASSGGAGGPGAG